MKSFGKPFVVEVKRSRRPTNALPKSLWHGVDLKAVAQEVEDQARELHLGAGLQPVDAEAKPLVIHELHEALTPTDDVDVIPDCEVAPENTISTSVVHEGEKEPVAERRGQRAPQKSAERRKTEAESLHAAVASSAVKLERQDSSDAAALGALEAENKRLRALWAARLESENCQLREMLSRLPK